MLLQRLCGLGLSDQFLRAGCLARISLHDPVKVGLPALAQAVECIVLDFPSARIAR